MRECVACRLMLIDDGLVQPGLEVHVALPHLPSVSLNRTHAHAYGCGYNWSLSICTARGTPSRAMDGCSWTSCSWCTSPCPACRNRRFECCKHSRSTPWQTLQADRACNQTVRLYPFVQPFPAEDAASARGTAAHGPKPCSCALAAVASFVMSAASVTPRHMPTTQGASAGSPPCFSVPYLIKRL